MKGLVGKMVEGATRPTESIRTQAMHADNLFIGGDLYNNYPAAFRYTLIGKIDFANDFDAVMVNGPKVFILQDHSTERNENQSEFPEGIPDWFSGHFEWIEYVSSIGTGDIVITKDDSIFLIEPKAL